MNMRMIEVPTATPTEIDLGDTAANIQRRRQEKEQSEKEKAEKQQKEDRERQEARMAVTLQCIEEAVAEKKDQELRGVKVNGNREWRRGQESQSQSRHKKKYDEHVFDRLRRKSYCGLCQGS